MFYDFINFSLNPLSARILTDFGQGSMGHDPPRYLNWGPGL